MIKTETDDITITLLKLVVTTVTKTKTHIERCETRDREWQRLCNEGPTLWTVRLPRQGMAAF